LTNTASTQISVINDAVAIIVDAVADFSASGGVANTFNIAINATIGAIWAGTSSSAARCAYTWHTIIDDPIAIVIDIVACLWDWALPTLAHQRAGLANKLPWITRPNTIAAWLPSVDWWVVGHAIAIIIQCVASFWWWSDFTSANQCTQYTNGRPKRALAGIASAANDSHISWIIIQHPITIVVQQVTYFGSWPNAALTHAGAALADQDARPTGSDVGTAGAANIGGPFIDLAIAIIVDAVANFFIGAGVVATLKCSTFANNIAFITRIGVATVTSSA
jgi:hypothetical protein